MPSSRKRIGFLPSEEVHEIIDKLCKANEFSQSKVTGLLVEEALRSLGVLNESFGSKTLHKDKFINLSFEEEPFSKNNKSCIVNMENIIKIQKCIDVDLNNQHIKNN